MSRFYSNLIYCPGYTEEEVGYNLSLVYGPEYSGTIVHQVRQNIVYEMRKCLFQVWTTSPASLLLPERKDSDDEVDGEPAPAEDELREQEEKEEEIFQRLRRSSDQEAQKEN